ncbi:hypothetical protein [Ruegeria atlantica]|uniref:hypothetical protein n=1 Tax=Ruegeria atlantica TaxID=81569 RepID=UPI002494080F|nr:hypothetical protein [Ruegeria atlantica]
MADFLKSYAVAEVGNLRRDKVGLRNKLQKMRDLRGEDAQEIFDLEYSIDIRAAHQEASDARVEYLMDLLDQAYGADKNPARIPAYKNPDDMRIPSGDREGEVVTMSDHIYLSKFAEVFSTQFASKWKHAKSWKDFLHDKISY